MTHNLLMDARSMKDSSGGEFILVNWQNSNYLAPTTGKQGEAGLWPEILREKLKT